MSVALDQTVAPRLPMQVELLTPDRTRSSGQLKLAAVPSAYQSPSGVVGGLS